MGDGDVLFEFVQIGQQMRVAAIDEASGTEIVVIAPLQATRQQMQSLALAKLRRKLAERSSISSPSTTGGKFA